MLRRALASLCLAALASSCTDAGGSQIGAIDPGTPTLLETTLESMRGQPVVVNYWATWCTPCKAEMPRIVDAAEEYGDRVRFLGVNVQDDVEAAAEWTKRFDVPFRSLSDPDGHIRRAQRINGLPVTQFYSPEGELAFVHQGEIEDEDLDEKITAILPGSLG